MQYRTFIIFNLDSCSLYKYKYIMHLISNTQNKYIINHKSTNEFYNYVQFNFDDKCFEQIQSIGCENMMQLDSETFELLNILGLNYLLFNYDINFDKAFNVQLSYIKHIENNIERFNAILIYLDYSPYYTMKSIDFDLKLCCEYGYIKMLDWVKQNTNYVLKFNSSHIIAICTTEHLNILDWIINNIDVHDVKTDIISIS